MVDHYATLVAEDGDHQDARSCLEQAIRTLCDDSRAAERERCAKLVETMDTTGHDGYIETTGDLCDALAARIRRA